MKMRLLLVLVAFALVVAVVGRLMPGAAGRVLYLGGPILTMDGEGTVAEALLVDGDRVLATGSAAELRTRAGESARVVELAGRAIVPGFIEAHGHFPGAGAFALHVDLRSPPVGSVATIEQAVALLGERAQATAEGDWVVGLGYDDTLLAERRHPTRADLDRVSTQHPIAVVHVSAHLAAVNSRALAELGITPATPDPEGGRIRRDPGTGEPDGVLEENAAEGVLRRLISPSPGDAYRILRAGSEMYLREGVTTAQAGFASTMQVWALAVASRVGLLPLRIVIWPSEEAADRLGDSWMGMHGLDNEWVRVGAVKVIADGSIQGYTGYLREPYYVPPDGDRSYRGYPRISHDDLLRRVARYHARGLQLAVHGNGDAAIDDILDALEYAGRKHPRADTRHVVVHAQMTRDDQLDRMKQLGVIPSFFPLHTYYWGDRHRDIFLGPERTERISPGRGAADRGIRFTIHADAPVVPMEPLRLVWSAVNRLSTSGAHIGDAQRISPLQALRAVTIDAARQHFEEDLKGSLEPGKLADFVILSKSPLADPEHIDRIRVLETVIGGRTVYRAEPQRSRQEWRAGR